MEPQMNADEPNSYVIALWSGVAGIVMRSTACPDALQSGKLGF